MSESDIPATENENSQADPASDISQSDVKNILKISNSLFKEWKSRTKFWWTQYRLIFVLVVVLSILPLLKLFLSFSNDVKFSFSWAFSLASYILAMCSYYFLRIQTQKIEETYLTYSALQAPLLQKYHVDTNSVSAFSKANTLNAGTTLVLAIISISSFWIAGNFNSDSFMSGSMLTIIAIIMLISSVAIVGKENHEFVHKIIDILKNIGTYVGKAFSLLGILLGIIIGALYILFEGIVKGITIAVGVDGNSGLRGAFHRLKRSIEQKFAEHKEKSETTENSSGAKQNIAPIALLAQSTQIADKASEETVEEIIIPSAPITLSETIQSDDQSSSTAQREPSESEK